MLTEVDLSGRKMNEGAAAWVTSNEPPRSEWINK